MLPRDANRWAEISLKMINVVEYTCFLHQARILASEAEKQELINASEGSAKAVVAAGEARAKSIEIVAKVSSSKSHQIVRYSAGPRLIDEIFTKPINHPPCPNINCVP